MHPAAVLQRQHLRQAIVDGVEGPEERVGNPLPPGADPRLLLLRVLPEGEVRFLQLPPQRVALRFGHVRLLVHPLLELVLLALVEDPGHRALQVHPAVILRPFPEEQLHIRPGEELHGHGVGLGHLGGVPGPLADFLVPLEVEVEPVPALMGHDVGVLGGTVEVGEDERRPVRLEERAIPAGLLALPGGHVVQAVVQEEVNVLLRFRRQPGEHLPGLLQAELLVPQGHRVAFQEADAVPGVEVLQTQTLPAALVQPGPHGYQRLLHLLPEACHVLRRVADAAHPPVAQRHIVGIAQQLRLTVPVVHQLVVQLLQLLPLLLPGGSHGLVHGLPDRPVR